jgi:ActR/RegA family two-component response regulator
VNSTLSTIAAYIDTEVAAIKAKTDNLPSDPADASDIAASFSTVNSTLSTIAAYIDTEVAAIKAKTDNLPSDPADQSAIEAAITAAQTVITTELAKVPKQGETRRYTQIAADEGNKTADVTIGAPL